MKITRRALQAGIAGSLMAPRAFAQQTRTVTLTRQPSILYIPNFLIERLQLVEKHAARLGAPGITTKWVSFNGGGAATDALLAESVDVVNTGATNMLLLWDRTRGRVKGIVATTAQPLILVTRDPRIQSIEDFRPTDKIAVPTVKISTQAILLQIASVEKWGKDAAFRLDANTVQLGHPDAVGAMLNPNGEISSHFSAPPFHHQALTRVPGARVVTDSTRIMGEPLSQACFFTTTKFAEGNPAVIEAIKAATREAIAMIRDDTPAAVKTYLQASNDPTSEGDLLDLLKQPGMLDYDARPRATLRLARHMFSTGVLKTEPANWAEYFLPSAADLQGT